MKIQYAIDFQDVGSNLRKSLREIGYNPDLQKMLRNIEIMVAELSKLEVIARRTHKTNITLDRIDQINKAINHLEKLILVAKLMQ